jgi:hypothetical protein
LGRQNRAVLHRYESVIGCGECEFIADIDEIKHGLKVLIDHYGYNEYPVDSCMGISHLLLGKIVLNKITGKKNLPGAMTSAFIPNKTHSCHPSGGMKAVHSQSHHRSLCQWSHRFSICSTVLYSKSGFS